MLRSLCFLLLAILATAALAQPPPGGYVPKRVQHLARVAEPPGGLVPYRKGRLWGYSDTTGRVVITPTFAQEPRPFMLGYGALAVDERPLFLNARGETLRAKRRQAVVLAPDSGLQLVDRRTAAFQPGIVHIGLTDSGQPTVFTEPITPPVGGDLYVRSLGAGRGIVYKNINERIRLLAPHYSRAALIDAGGRRLTPFAYAEILPFREGRAPCRRTGNGRSSWGLLDAQGREVLPTRYSSVSSVHNNRVVVGSLDNLTQYYALLDSTGAVVSPPGTSFLKWLVPGKVLLENLRTGGAGTRLLDHNAQPLLGDRRFVRVEPLRNGSIEVSCAPGQMGLLDAQLNWLVPCQRQRFYQRSDYASPDQDSLYRVVVREGRHGVLRTRDGKLVVPCRYDTVYRVLYPHFYEAERAGQRYVLNGRGQEISPGNALDLVRARTDYPAHGPLVAVLRPDGMAAALDSSGRPLTPWWPYTVGTFGCSPPVYAAKGLSLVSDCATGKTGVATQQGQLLLPFSGRTISYQSGTYVTYQQRTSSALHGEEVLIYNSDLQLIGSFPASTGLPMRLPHGWLGTLPVLLDSQGKRYVAPFQTDWQRQVLLDNYALYPFEFGYWKTDQGYVTRHGRLLWED